MVNNQEICGLPWGSITELSAGIRDGAVSPVDAVEVCLERIESCNDSLNAFVTVLPERAREQAERAERDISNGRYRSPMHGVPIAVKDNVYTKDVRTTMGSFFFRDHVPEYSANIVERLESAGAVIVGKTNTHEFAYGGTGDRSFFGPPHNPHDHSRMTGGSSSGSAAAVAAGCVPGAIGTDTGGSVRIPASLCGVVGMKPTYGRVSTHGVFPLSSTLDHVGPLTTTVEDNAIVLSVLSSGSAYGSDRSDWNPAEFTNDLRAGVDAGIVGIPSTHYFDDLDADVERRILEAIEVFRARGAKLRSVEVPLLREAVAAQRDIMATEAYAIHEERLNNDPDHFDPEVRHRLLEGRSIETHQYTAALKLRDSSRAAFLSTLSDVDVLLTPTTAIPAPELQSRTARVQGGEESVRTSLNRLTGPTSFNGFPSLSVPCTPISGHLPMGLQLVGRPHDEATLYRYGYAYQSEAD